jgi:hypothetical protein
MLYKFGSMDVDILSYTIGQIETRMLRNSQKSFSWHSHCNLKYDFWRAWDTTVILTIQKQGDFLQWYLVVKKKLLCNQSQDLCNLCVVWWIWFGTRRYPLWFSQPTISVPLTCSQLRCHALTLLVALARCNWSDIFKACHFNSEVKKACCTRTKWKC